MDTIVIILTDSGVIWTTNERVRNSGSKSLEGTKYIASMMVKKSSVMWSFDNNCNVFETFSEYIDPVQPDAFPKPR